MADQDRYYYQSAFVFGVLIEIYGRLLRAGPIRATMPCEAFSSGCVAGERGFVDTSTITPIDARTFERARAAGWVLGSKAPAQKAATFQGGLRALPPPSARTRRNAKIVRAGGASRLVTTMTINGRTIAISATVKKNSLILAVIQRFVPPARRIRETSHVQRVKSPIGSRQKIGG